MSYFSDQNPTTDTVQNPGQVTNTAPEDYVSMIVSEKGEQWKDPQAIAKGYVHAQKRIKELEDAVAANSKNDYAKELLATLRQGAAAPVAAQTQETKPNGTDEQKTTDKSVDIQSLIESTLTEREKTRIAEQNLKVVDAKLTELFGTEAQATINAKAAELGMSKARLQEIASESPNAFLTLIGAPASKQTNQVMTSKVNTSSIQGPTGERNQEYYTKLRRTNRALYNKPETQNAMMADALRLGPNFYK